MKDNDVHYRAPGSLTGLPAPEGEGALCRLGRVAWLKAHALLIGLGRVSVMPACCLVAASWRHPPGGLVTVPVRAAAMPLPSAVPPLCLGACAWCPVLVALSCCAL